MYPKKMRKIRICLAWKGNFYSFCWIELLEDHSFSLGFQSKNLKFTEYGSAILAKKRFSNHMNTLTNGNIDIKNAISPHISFHPPKIDQKKGIVHMVAKNGVVDEFELDWYPVNKFDRLLYAYTGDIARLDKDIKKRYRYQDIFISPTNQCLRMELAVYPRIPPYPKPPKILVMPNAIGDFHGFSPEYIISCYFYKNEIVKPAIYFAAET